jgi:hypothetical protein
VEFVEDLFPLALIGELGVAVGDFLCCHIFVFSKMDGGSDSGMSGGLGNLAGSGFWMGGVAFWPDGLCGGAGLCGRMGFGCGCGIADGRCSETDNGCARGVV